MCSIAIVVLISVYCRSHGHDMHLNLHEAECTAFPSEGLLGSERVLLQRKNKHPSHHVVIPAYTIPGIPFIPDNVNKADLVPLYNYYKQGSSRPVDNAPRVCDDLDKNHGYRRGYGANGDPSGLIGYIFLHEQPGTVPLVNWYSKSTNDHAPSVDSGIPNWKRKDGYRPGYGTNGDPSGIIGYIYPGSCVDGYGISCDTTGTTSSTFTPPPGTVPLVNWYRGVDSSPNVATGVPNWKYGDGFSPGYGANGDPSGLLGYIYPGPCVDGYGISCDTTTSTTIATTAGPTITTTTTTTMEPTPTTISTTTAEPSTTTTTAEPVQGSCSPVWDFTLNINSDLFGILKGPATGSGKTELHALSAASNYQSFNLQTATALEMSYGVGQDWDFVMDDRGNLYSILKGPVSGSGKTELHVLTAASNYQTFSLQTATALGYTTDSNWDFALKANLDLVGILKGPVTGSGKTEVHILSSSTNYKTFALQTGTGLHYTTDADWAFQVNNENGDLVCILKGPTTGSGKTEVHTLSAASNYQGFSLQVATALHITNGNWDWACKWNSGCDLFGILRGPSGSGNTEIHAMTSVSNYQHFALQVATGLHYTNAICTSYQKIGDGQCMFASGTWTSIGWASCTCPGFPDKDCNKKAWPPMNCASISACAADCDKADGCVAFDWEPGWCWLFSGTPGSYVKTSDAFTFFECYANPR